MGLQVLVIYEIHPLSVLEAGEAEIPANLLQDLIQFPVFLGVIRLEVVFGYGELPRKQDRIVHLLAPGPVETLQFLCGIANLGEYVLDVGDASAIHLLVVYVLKGGYAVGGLQVE